MLQLPNNCYCTEPSICPKNWKSLKKIHGNWRLYSVFYDPAHLDKEGKIIPFNINKKKINRYSTIAERKKAGEYFIDELKRALLAGYNPWKKEVVKTANLKSGIEPTTYFIDALKAALERIKIDPKTKKEIANYIIANVERAAKLLSYDYLTIAEVRRRHIIFILDHIRETSKAFTDNTFNHYRKYIRILFTELVNIGAIESNIINDIKKKPVEQTEREVLTSEQRTYINSLLGTKPDFHRFLHIFFHSGARITELIKLKRSDVDLPGQRFRSEIKKGRKSRTVWRPIKNIALQYWKEAIKDCGQNDYLFSKGLKPGPVPINSYQITKRWYRLVIQKEHIINGKKQKIKATFYALKHLNSTEMVDQYGIEVAATLNAHTSNSMVAKVYDIKSKERINDKIKQANNPF